MQSKLAESFGRQSKCMKTPQCTKCATYEIEVWPFNGVGVGLACRKFCAITITNILLPRVFVIQSIHKTGTFATT